MCFVMTAVSVVMAFYNLEHYLLIALKYQFSLITAIKYLYYNQKLSNSVE